MLARLTLRILNVVPAKDNRAHYLCWEVIDTYDRFFDESNHRGGIVAILAGYSLVGCHMQDLKASEYSHSFRISSRLWRAELECLSTELPTKHSFHSVVP